jgi:hypothetical protein
MFSRRFLVPILVAHISIERISSFGLGPRPTSSCIRKGRTASSPPRPTFLRYTVIGGVDEEEEPEKDPWAVASSATSLTPKRSESAQTKTVAHGPGDLSGYSDEYVEKEVDDLNVDAYDSAAGQIMPGFNLSGLCGDD